VLLTQPPLTLSVREYQQLQAAVRQAQERSESAARAYEEHAAAHGCETHLPARRDPT
jgi:hypothetical protein